MEGEALGAGGVGVGCVFFGDMADVWVAHCECPLATTLGRSFIKAQILKGDVLHVKASLW